MFNRAMTQQEIIKAMDDIGCTGDRLARWLNVTPATVTNWRVGRRNIPGPAVIAIKALASGWRP